LNREEELKASPFPEIFPNESKTTQEDTPKVNTKWSFNREEENFFR
jgi:hypothetical protein